MVPPPRPPAPRRFALAALLLVGAASAAPRTWYVSPQGADAGPGTREAPWASPGPATRRMGPGDTLVLLPGRYRLERYDEDVLVPPSGTAAAWTEVRAEPGAVLAGAGNLLTAVALGGRSYVRLVGLEITAAAGEALRDGIEVLGEPAHHLRLEGLFVHHLDEFGFNAADVADLEIVDSRFTHCGFGAVGGPAGEAGGWQRVRIARCSLSWSGHHYQGGPGPSPYERPDGFGIEASAGPVEIVDTLAEKNRGDGLDSKAARTLIRRCTVRDNGCDGVKLWAGPSRVESTLIHGVGDGYRGGSPWAGLVLESERAGDRFEVVNVTLDDDPGRENYPAYVQYDRTDVPITVTFVNTLVTHGYGSLYFGPSVAARLDHCIVYRPGDPVQVEAGGREFDAGALAALGPGNLSVDPRYRRRGGGPGADLRLAPGSPAADSGTPVGAAADDLGGRARPRGRGVDRGAFED